MTERLHFQFSVSCIGEGNGNSLQCSCLENPRDRGAWWVAVYGVAQNWTRLKRLRSSSSSSREGGRKEGEGKRGYKEVYRHVQRIGNERINIAFEYNLPELGFPGGSAGKEFARNAGDLSSIPGLGRSPGEGKGYLLQYSGLENSMDCIVHKVAKSWTGLSDFHFNFPELFRELKKERQMGRAGSLESGDTKRRGGGLCSDWPGNWEQALLGREGEHPVGCP